MSEEASRLLYRNGFVIASEDPALDELSSWTSDQFGGLVLRVHPDATSVKYSNGLHQGILIGSAFDPEEQLFQEIDVLKQMLHAYGDEAKFAKCLNRVAGRFALLIFDGQDVDIYHDAMGARSIFYGSSSKCVAASHAELASRVAGSGFADFFIPFITSRNYISRDVKYLPGVVTPYEGIKQLTPNTFLRLKSGAVHRYWPIAAESEPSDHETAVRALVQHLEGLGLYLASQHKKPVVGLTAGTDSRGVLAAVRSADPYLFTYVRSPDATSLNSVDAKRAQELAGAYGLESNIWAIPNRLSLNAVDDSFSYAFRRSTGYYRGPGSPWLRKLRDVDIPYSEGLFVRGFGGEVMRGFYQNTRNRITRLNGHQLSDAYDVNSGSKIVRSLFTEMIDLTGMDEGAVSSYDLNDIFYWEHRMGTWGAVSMAEADLAANSVVGYSSRNLYTTFMKLPQEQRDHRQAFVEATRTLAPKLAEIE